MESKCETWKANVRLSFNFSDSEGLSSSKKKTKKRKTTKDDRAKRTKPSVGGEAQNSKTTTKSATGTEVHLPPEILLKIFQMAVAEEGAFPFLNRYDRN